jgi:Arc/MetJ-type ribon-helix-helix transcriptional regulator
VVLQYYICDTLIAVEKAISIRLDDEAQRALSALTASGRKQSEVVREALVELARREDRASLADEVQRLNADPRDRAEKAEIARLMERLRAAR